ncbi:ABC transporter permease [Pseudomonas sp. CAN2814]|uniref:ABC transporter permease n=1 Tax=Pseudomonas sp. CAN1 TaxID=3046726 RepID=UPI0026495703|nr:ABC transporter permease [Pseudomonas sp. CAN1]MDN6858124.1 ABC transporter permease [Pseudomonas sp. CAN1]
MVTALIELDGIVKHYGGGASPKVTVLHGVSLCIEPGEFVAIVGASGSGKSTLMHILGCLDRPSAGSYRFAGNDVAQMDSDELAWLRREAFGFVFQGYHLIPTCSARENVEVPALYAGRPVQQRQQRASDLLQRLGLGERLDNRPNQLSGGQQQRVSIARALMNGGRIILADEPTGALDSRSGEEVMALLDELSAQGHTLILITHDREVAARARRVIEIRDGHIVADSGGQAGAAALPLPDLRDARLAGGASFASDLLEALRSAWRVMWLNRFRTALTLLGIVIGVASVIVMLAIGLGTKQRVVQQMASLGATIMYVSGDHPPEGGPMGAVTLDDLAAVAELPQVRHVMPVIGNALTVRYGNLSKSLYTFATTEQMPLIHRWPVAQGRFFSAAEDRELAPLVVLGHKAWQYFFPAGESPLGRQLLVGNALFEVIGVMKEKGADSGVEDYDEMLFIPFDSGRARVYKGMTDPEYAVIDAMSPALVHQADAAMQELLLERHGRKDFGVGNAAAKLQAQAEAQDSMTLMLSLIAAVSLLVGGIGVMNVMLMTVRERTREIGIRVATGACQRDILRQFLSESTLLSLVGGLIGVAIGLSIGAGLLLAGVPVVFSLTAILGAFGCALITGLVFGYAPARQAARLDPVVALGGE